MILLIPLPFVFFFTPLCQNPRPSLVSGLHPGHWQVLQKNHPTFENGSLKGHSQQPPETPRCSPVSLVNSLPLQTFFYFPSLQSLSPEMEASSAHGCPTPPPPPFLTTCPPVLPSFPLLHMGSGARILTLPGPYSNCQSFPAWISNSLPQASQQRLIVI